MPLRDISLQLLVENLYHSCKSLMELIHTRGSLGGGAILCGGIYTIDLLGGTTHIHLDVHNNKSTNTNTGSSISSIQPNSTKVRHFEILINRNCYGIIFTLITCLGLALSRLFYKLHSDTMHVTTRFFREFFF